MIEISSAQQLALLFPKSNKAISKILESASPEQLKNLSEAKDLKAILSQLMNDTLDTSKSNKIILDILKNSEFFKELGSFSKEMKVLVELLEAENNPNKKIDKLLQVLKLSLLDFKQGDSAALKDFVKNSGVFLESKFLQDNSPKAELHKALQDLKSLLTNSNEKATSPIIKNIQGLLNNETAFSKNTDLSSLNLIKKELGSLVSSLNGLIKSSTEPLYAKEVQILVTKLQTLSQGAQKNESFSLSTIKNLMHEISSELRISPKDTSKALVTKLEGIESKIENIIKDNSSKPLLKSLASALQGLDIKNLSANELKAFKAGQSEIQTLSQMRFEEIQSLKFDDVKAFFAGFSESFSSLGSSNTKSIFDIIEKILSSLKQTEQAFTQAKVPKDIKNWIANFDKELSKSDVIFSKDFQAKLDKILQLSMPSHLLDNKLLQENLQRDIKALLLGIEKELSVNPSLQTNDILKSLDKLLVQIDYFQLLSHLSNASYLYLPYTWDGLQNGKFSFKNKDDGSCYCEIDLELKEHGKLNMMLQLFDDNQLNMNIYTQSIPLKEIFKTHIKELREALVKVQIMPRNIHLYEFDERKKNSYAKTEALNELGFEVKG
ncbi:MAG: hypothetical protein COA44_09045 [Arcobacter sp.]|nr:MAG: hypothetical protein COA44_09045 [Arcobacter sp.]